MICRAIEDVLQEVEGESPFVIYEGDCFELLEALPPSTAQLVLSSPPYFMGKEYDRSYALSDFLKDHSRLAPLLESVTASTGSICWQTGSHVRENRLFPLDYAVFSTFSELTDLRLRNRIIWHFGHGIHATRRFSGRYETVMWFTKSDQYVFDLDAVRVPQKYPGKRHYKGPHKGEYSGNPFGKNPSDVWEIPNVKANHVEKTAHPCQFPVALCQRLIRALTRPGDIVIDPFCGSGSAGLAAALEGRRFVGSDISARYCLIAEQRYADLLNGKPKFRPERDVWQPRGDEAVAQRPPHFSEV